ncbi:hypothetical protein PMAN_a0957 [Pseudoalteromonas marina]|nr:hypothetical protein PMAN_a0957 [Pseudoalteromonas marina]
MHTFITDFSKLNHLNWSQIKFYSTFTAFVVSQKNAFAFL